MISCRVKTEGFEGPLDLLLRLVDREELDITRLSLARVADDFLGEMESREIELAELSEFLLIASQLILIKSKALLPLFEFTREEEEEIGDLEERLKEYRAFKKAAAALREKAALKKVFFSRPAGEKPKLKNRFVNPGITSQALKKYWEEVLEKNSPTEKLEERIMEEVVTLEDKISHLKEALERRTRVVFQESIRGASNKIEVVVAFLAVLEMVKRKIVLVTQAGAFGEIVLERNSGLIAKKKTK